MLSFNIKYLIPVTLATLLTACGGGAAGGSSGVTDNSGGFTTNKPQASATANSSSLSSPSKPASSSSVTSIAKSSKASTTIDTAPPSAPTNLIGTNVFHDRVAIKWDEATDNVGVALYKIYRDGIEISTNINTEQVYFDFDVAAHKTYVYGVSAGDAAGNWSALSTIEVTTLAAPNGGSNETSSTSSSKATSSSNSQISAAASSKSSAGVDTTPPSAPSQLNKVNALSTQVDISWTAATDNVGVTTYKIYRNSALLATVGKDVLSYSDKTSLPGASYWYGVSAGDAAGNWSEQKQLNIITPNATTTTISLNWLPPTQRENGVALSLNEIGGYEMRYKTAYETIYNYKSLDKNQAQITLAGLSSDNLFEIAVYDTDGIYSNFVSLKSK